MTETVTQEVTDETTPNHPVIDPPDYDDMIAGLPVDHLQPDSQGTE